MHEVERILDRRKRKKQFEYYVQWKGYDAADNTWEPERYSRYSGSRSYDADEATVGSYAVYCSLEVTKRWRHTIKPSNKIYNLFLNIFT